MEWGGEGQKLGGDGADRGMEKLQEGLNPLVLASMPIFCMGCVPTPFSVKSLAQV